ncbi:MAG: hypothetical protein PVF68_08380 [Acidobacteriota bacterium]|jgi:hypothetical protein
MTRRTSRLSTLAISTLLGLASAAAVQGAADAPPEGLEPLQYGFRFASAIHDDPVDRGQAQGLVVSDLVRLGLLDEAMSLAAEVDGWQRGVSHAEIAVALAGAGRTADAQAQLAEARKAEAAADGWHRVRIQSHIAEALAALGRVQDSAQLAESLAQADPNQYKGRSAATVALGQAEAGDLDAAVATLQSIEGDDDIMVAAFRTTGYLDLAKDVDLSREKRIELIDAASRSATGLKGWHRSDAAQEIALAYQGLGEEKKARDALDGVTGMLLELDPKSPVKAPLLARLAGTWVRIGDRKQAAHLLREAENAVEIETRMVTETPVVRAQVAAGYLELGDDRAWVLYGEAMTDAEGLVNPRPRALALVGICRSLGRVGAATLPAELKARMDASLEGFERAS